MTTLAANQTAAVQHRSVAELRRRRRVLISCIVVAAVTLTAMLVYQFAFVGPAWEYTMQLRFRQIGALIIAGVAVGVSSIMFQTVTGNRILTPGIMGFDALYVLIQTIIVFFFGAGTLLLMGAGERALLNMVFLTLFGVLLFRALFRRLNQDLLVLVLVGVVLSGLFASLTSLASRMLDPTDFLTLQDVMFASFNTVNQPLMYTLAVVTVIVLAASLPLWRKLDVIALGYRSSVCLGINFHRTVTWTLVCITMLVAASTALVGPMTFLGLLVANVARQLVPTSSHMVLLPLAAACGIVATVAGQMVVMHIFDHTTTLSVVVNLVGGCYFLWLVWRSARS